MAMPLRELIALAAEDEDQNRVTGTFKLPDGWQGSFEFVLTRVVDPDGNVLCDRIFSEVIL